MSYSWYRKGTCSVINGDARVNFQNADITTAPNKPVVGDAFVVNYSDIYEVIFIGNDSVGEYIMLDRNYEQATAQNTKYAFMRLASSNQNAKLVAQASAAINQKQISLEDMHEWYTLQQDEVDFTQPDGTTVKIPSWYKFNNDLATIGPHLPDVEVVADNIDAVKAAPAAAQTATDKAAEAAVSAQKAEDFAIKLGPENNPANLKPAFHWSASSGLQVFQGNAVNDKINVGGQDIELPSKSLEFFRSGQSYCINKSGVVKLLGDNEPCITKDGLQLFGAATNYKLTSNQSGGWVDPGGTLVTESSSELGPDLSTNAWLMKETGVQGSSVRMYTSVNAPQITESYNYSLIVKPKSKKLIFVRCSDTPVGAPKFNLEDCSIFSDASGIYSNAKIERLTNGFLRVSVDIESANTQVWVQSLGDNGETSFTPVNGDGYYIWHTQITNGKGLKPIIVTQGSPVSTVGQYAQFPIMGNLPPVGSPFTIVTECYIDENHNTLNSLFSNEYTVTSSIALFKSTSGALSCVVSNGSGQSSFSKGGLTGGEKYLVCIVFDGEYCQIYADGVSGPKSRLTPHFDITKDIFLGALGLSHGSSLNDHLPYLTIYHEALTENQVKALGVA